MKLCWCTLHVKELEKSLAFYRDIVGLNVLRRFGAGPGMEIVFLGDEGSEFELMSDGQNHPVDMGVDISLGFEVKSLDEQMALVQEKGFPIHSGPFQPNPHVRFFFIKDPDGLSIQFVKNM